MGDSTVSIINMTNGTLIATVPAGTSPSCMAIHARTNTALIMDHLGSAITFLDLTPYVGDVVTAVQPHGKFPVVWGELKRD